MSRSRSYTRMIVGLIAVGVVACGSGSSATQGSARPPSESGTTARAVSAEAPSKSAKMICGDEVRRDLEGSLGAKTAEPIAPTWVDHVYSCRYVYPGGVLVLSVKELPNQRQTNGYFEQLRGQLGQHGKAVKSLGDAAFSTTNGSLVVRKDFKVLLVDVAGLPTTFGSAALSRRDVGFTVGSTVMGCWTGA